MALADWHSDHCGGCAGEAGFIFAWLGFVVGKAGWGYTLYDIFAGEAGSVAATGDKVSEHVKTSFNTMRFIVTAGRQAGRQAHRQAGRHEGRQAGKQAGRQASRQTGRQTAGISTK